jgi:hypothetical protein
MKPGDTLTFNERDVTTGGFEQGESYSGPSRVRDAKETKWYNRTLSWFGTGAIDGAAGDQGLSNDGGDFSIGKSKGPTWLARVWNFLRGWFWIFAFTGLGLAVLYFVVPATQPIIGMIWKWVTGILTLGMSWIYTHVKQSNILNSTQTTATNLQAAVDQFPSVIQALPPRQANEVGEGFTQGQKTAVIALHQQTHTV